MYTIAFWKGVRLWQMASALRAQPAGQNTPRVGASRRRGRLDNRGPNFLYQISVNCWIPAIGGDHTESKAAFSGRGKQVTRQVYSAKTLELLVEKSGYTEGLGQLAWVEDMRDYRTVTVGHAGGAAATITTAAAASGWAPSVGDLVAVVNPETGDGFTATVDGYAAGVITLDAWVYTNDRDQADGEPVQTEQAITTDFRVYDVAYYYDKVKFLQMSDPPAGSNGEDRWSPQINYQFMSETGIIYPSAYSPDFN